MIKVVEIQSKQDSQLSIYDPPDGVCPDDAHNRLHGVEAGPLHAGLGRHPGVDKFRHLAPHPLLPPHPQVAAQLEYELSLDLVSLHEIHHTEEET